MFQLNAEYLGYLIVISLYFILSLGVLFPIIYWIKPRSTGIIQVITSWFQTSLVMIGYVSFLWLASRDMTKTNLYIVLFGLVIFFFGVFIVLDSLFTIKTGVIIPLDKIVTKNIYGCARHPFYVGTFFILVGLSVCFGSVYALIQSGITGVMLVFLTIPEEKDLVLRFKKYKDYKKEVSRFNVFKVFSRKKK